MMETMGAAAAGWQWDETLYAGAAPYYGVGRMPYPGEVANALRSELGLDGTGRLLDVGCGPGPLTLLLAPLFGSATGVDGSAGMIAAARARARRAGVANVDWLLMRAEDIPPGLGRFRVVTFAQSFHWLDRPRVARLVAGVLEPAGACVLVYATTHEGVPGDHPLPLPRPPRAEIYRLVEAYLGSTRRAGRGTRSAAAAVSDETMGFSDEDVLSVAGFSGPTRLTVGGGRVAERTEDEIVASVFSLSFAAPHLLGARRATFERDMRALLRRVSPTGRFCEEPRGITVDVWRPAP